MKAIDFLQEMNAAARSRASISLKVSVTADTLWARALWGRHLSCTPLTLHAESIHSVKRGSWFFSSNIQNRVHNEHWNHQYLEFNRVVGEWSVWHYGHVVFDPLAEVFDHVLVLHPFDIHILFRKKKGPSAHDAILRLGADAAEPMPSLTLGLIPSTPSGTLGKASYSVETYVMTDFSSGDWTSTSREEGKAERVTR